MGIEETVLTNEKHLPDADKKLFKKHLQFVDPKGQNELMTEHFEGVKGGVSTFTNKHLYTSNFDYIERLHGDKDKPEGEALETHILETLVDRTMKALDGNTEAEQWRNQWSKKKKSFETEKEKQNYLVRMGRAVFGWGDNEEILARQYSKAAAANKLGEYNTFLGQLAEKTNETLLQRGRKEIEAQIESSERLTLNARDFYAHRMQVDHDKTLRDLDQLDRTSYKQLAQDYLDIAVAKIKNEDNTAKSKGYVDVKKED